MKKVAIYLIQVTLKRSICQCGIDLLAGLSNGGMHLDGAYVLGYNVRLLGCLYLYFGGDYK